jgi:hypothetical protein
MAHIRSRKEQYPSQIKCLYNGNNTERTQVLKVVFLREKERNSVISKYGFINFNREFLEFVV